MRASLDEIFEKILISEREAQSQKTSLHELKSKITQAEACIKGLDEEISSLKGQMLFQVQKLSGKEVILKSLKIKEEMLFRRQQKLKTEKEDSEKVLKDFQEQLRNLTEHFCLTASEFFNKYGFQKEIEDRRKNKKQSVRPRVQLRLEYPQMVWGERSETEAQEDAHSMDKGESWENGSNSDILITDDEFQRVKEEFENCDDDDVYFPTGSSNPEVKSSQDMD